MGLFGSDMSCDGMITVYKLTACITTPADDYLICGTKMYLFPLYLTFCNRNNITKK